jgi:AcrR family transcriptional regulator
MNDRKLTKRGSQRRDQILQMAGRLFAEAGYHGATVGDVCDTLGVGKGVFYWYFPSKEALFSELLQNMLLDLRRAQETAIGEESDPVARIEAGIRASIAYFKEDPGMLSLLRIAGRYDEFAGLVEQGQRIVVADTAFHIKEGMSVGSIRPGDPEVMAHGILGATFHFVEVYLDNEDAAVEANVDLSDEAVAFCLRGLLK